MMTSQLHRLLLVCLLLLSAMILAACGPLTFTVGAEAHRELEPTVVEADGHLFSDRIAIVDVSGLLLNSTKPGIIRPGENPVGLLKEKLEAARFDPRVKGIILRLNTPGGGVTASDAMYREVLRFKQQTHKPVVALLMDVAASGGYYLACSADAIVTYPTSVTGSIGVIVQTMSFKPALNRWGIEAEAITSGPNKDVASPLSQMTIEHRAVLHALVDDFYARFLKVVRQARPNIPPERFAELTDGRIISGREAVAAGLADAIGDIYDAQALVMKMAHIRHADLVLYHRPLEYVGSPYAQTPVSGGTQINLAQINLEESASGLTSGFYYLWQPGLSWVAPSP